MPVRPTTSTATSKAIVNIFHDEEFYFQDVIFQVENRLFKLPRHVFVHRSQIFRDMFSLPVPEGTQADGTSDDNPLILDGIMAIDFIRLLRYIFPAIRQPSYPRPQRTLDEWTSIFKLAALWDMEDVKEKAVQTMTELFWNSPAKQVQLALEHRVGEWLLLGLQRLVERAEPLDRVDVDLIGLEYALKVMALREDCRYDRSRWTIHKRGEVRTEEIDMPAEIVARFGIRTVL